jgi:hypothetical protein
MANYRIDWDDGNKPRVEYGIFKDDMDLLDWLQHQKDIPLDRIDVITQERNVKFKLVTHILEIPGVKS